MFQLHTALLLGLLLLLSTNVLTAQILRLGDSGYCAYTIERPDTEIIISAYGEEAVEAMVATIVDRMGSAIDFRLAAANVPSVLAFQAPETRYLLYNARFCRKLLAQAPQQLYLLLAHEVSHLVYNHDLGDDFRLYQESAADEWMGRAAFRTELFRGFPQVERSLQLQPFFYADRYPAGMRGQRVSAGWLAEEAVVRSKDNLGFLTDKQDDLPLPLFYPRGCPRIHDFSRASFRACTDLKSVDQQLVRALQRLGYERRAYYAAPGGFALLTPVEQIKPDGSPLEGSERWQDYPAGGNFEGLFDYLSSLIVGRPGYFRLFAFVVTDQQLQHSDGEMDAGIARSWLRNGGYWLPDQIGILPLTDNYRISVFIYEFEAPASTKQMKEFCEILLSVGTHLQESGINGQIRRP